MTKGPNMLTQPTIEKLNAMKLTAMAKAFETQIQCPDMAQLSFEERFGLIVDYQMTALENRRMQNRLKTAKLRLSATIEDLDFRNDRNLDRSTIMSLAQNQWVRNHHNILVTGPTGSGKSYLACAFGNHACRRGFTVRYFRTPRFFQALAVARGTGRYDRVLRSLLRIDLLIIDDWGTALLTDEERRDLFEIVEDRYDRRSTLIAAQLPVEHWHDIIGDPTLADAILDRLIHNAHTITLKGESMRKRNPT